METQVTGECRTAFVNFLTPDERDGKLSYSVMLLMQPDSEAFKELLKWGSMAIAEAFAENPPALRDIQHPFKRCDDVNAERESHGKDPLEGYEPGMVAVAFRKPKSKDPKYHDLFTPPGLFDKFGKPMVNVTAETIYSGMWGRVTFEPKYYPAAGQRKQGLGFWLRDFMKTRDDSRFAGGVDSGSLFAKYAQAETEEARRARRDAASAPTPERMPTPPAPNPNSGFDGGFEEGSGDSIPF